MQEKEKVQEKSEAAKLKEKLFHKPKHAGFALTDARAAQIEAFAADYRAFSDYAKTERRAVARAVADAEARGFEAFRPGTSYKPGDKVYLNNRDKALVLAVVGKAPLSEGVAIAAAHIDSPRIDLKPNPLYEDNELALFKTHYYGGIKKYQWTALPLALYGVVVRADGTKVEVNLGDDESEPCFVITDLLPHLATEQYKRPLHEGIKGEELNVLVGSMPFKDDKESEAVKLNILRLLNEKYGITERDFLTAELALVPAGKSREIGFDRSMLGAYGHDDRVCAYPALRALLDLTETPRRTAVAVLADKEETGSDGNTGLQGAYLRNFIFDLAEPAGFTGRSVLSKSECLSADVNAAFDPTFADVLERRNAAYLNRGVVITKYTGSRGKSGTSDASAEFVGKICAMLDRRNVPWQIGELGKVDLGGGGTVAKYVANLDVDTVDIGVPVLSMHSPFEVVAKTDLYAAYEAFSVFFRE